MTEPIDPGDHFKDTQIAAMLGVNPVTVRQWRRKNKEVGAIKFGPPYEYRGRAVVYPKQAFRKWCATVTVVDGVPRMNLPLTATIEPPSEPVLVVPPSFDDVEKALAT